MSNLRDIRWLNIRWLIFSAPVFVACILILFRIVIDLFRDRALGDGFKALA